MYKRNYHPLVILLYTSGMLDVRQISELPKTTKYNWNQFKHENYYGNDWAKNYINQFEDIKAVFASAFLYKSLRFLIETRKGYLHMLQEFSHNKQLLKLHANKIITSIEKMKSLANVNVVTACKYYGISKDWYYSQKKKLVCNISQIQKCYKQHPQQLTINEIASIENLVADTDNFGKTKVTLYYHALRNSLIFCGKSTFNKYASALGYIKPKRFRYPIKKGLRASRVFEWLHVDITNVNTIEDGIQKVAFVKDNFSRAILHYNSTSGKAGSEFIKNLFAETFSKYNLLNAIKPINILSDGGPENKGELLSWINTIQAPLVVTKITAQTKYFPFSNSMSESTHSIYKTEFLHGKYSLNEKTHLKDIERFVEYYNHYRYPTNLFGLTPLEVVNGKIPDKNHFKEKIQEARKNRVVVNQQLNVCKIVIGCNS
jgi:transposase InsO family protein